MLSMNFLQYSIAFPIMAWVCLLTTILCQVAVFFRELKEVYSNMLLVMHYACLAVWYAAIFASYMYNAYS